METRITNDIQDDSLYLIYTPTIHDLPFTITGAGHFKANSNYSVERDNLYMSLLFYVKNGSGTVTYKNRSVDVFKNQAFLLDGGCYHHFHTSKNASHWEFKWLRFIGSSSKFYEEYINNDSLYVYELADFVLDETIDSVIKIIKSEQHTRDVLMSHYVSVALTHLCHIKSTTHQKTNKLSPVVHEAKVYLEKHYNDDISIDTLSKSLYINKYTLIRRFKEHFSISPYAYLITVRIHHSKYLLEQTTTPIHTIAELVGFNNVNNYIYNFKNLTLMTPKEYRNRCAYPSINCTI